MWNLSRRNRFWSFCFLLLTLAAGLLVLNVIARQVQERQEQAALSELPEGWQVLLRGENVMSVAEQDDVIWAGGRSGVYKIDRRSGALEGQMDWPWRVTYVTAVLVDHQDRLWVGHEEGVTVWDGNTHTRYTAADVLPDNRVNALYRDSADRIWVGTWTGAAYYDGSDWDVLTVEDGLAANMVNTIMEDSLGHLWFGAYAVPDGAVSIRRNDSWQHFSTSEGLPNNNVTAFLEVERGIVWVGTGFLNRGGAAQFVHGDKGWALNRTMKKEDGLAGEKVRSLYRDNLGNIWFGSEFDGITITRDESMLVLTEDDGLSHPEILSILQDADGNIWLGTLDGITRLEYDTIRQISRSLE